MVPILGTLITSAIDIIGRFIPDPEEKAKAQLEVMKLQQSSEFKQIEADLQSMQMQADINKTEAAHANVWVAGWRPFIGWVCGAGLALQFILFPMVFWIGQLANVAIIMPQLPFEMIMTMLGGMLGIGGMHTYEKVKGVVKGAS